MLDGCGDGHNLVWQEAHAGPIISVGFRQLTLFHLVPAIKAIYFSIILHFGFHKNFHFSFIKMHYRLSLLVLNLSGAISVHASDAWTVNCAPLTVQRSDSLLSPGAASGHVHAVVGGTAFRRSMSSIDSAVDALQTTCDKFTDHSNYVRCSVCKQRNPYTDITSGARSSII
jgi:hypothetical protein